MSDDRLYDRVAQILEQARSQVARTVNTAMVQAYWLIGREIVEVEQAGEARAGYGEEVLQRLSARLKTGFGKGFGIRTLRNIRQFYLMFPKGSALPEIRQAALAGSATGEPGIGQALLAGSQDGTSRSSFVAASFPPAIGWTHYLILMRVPRPEARAFYEIEAARECWSTRQLERQIGSLLFDRLARQRDPEAVRALARAGQEVATPADVLKEPFVLEFLDLDAHPALRERDIEQAIIDRLEAFLLELARASASSAGRSG